MMHGRNPLAHSQLDDDPDDLEYYGYDPQGPSPLESNNVVVVPQITLGNNNEEIRSFVLQNLNPLSQSSDMGVEIKRRHSVIVLVLTVAKRARQFGHAMQI